MLLNNIIYATTFFLLAFAAQALELSKAQEETKQKEIITKAKEFEVGFSIF